MRGGGDEMGASRLIHKDLGGKGGLGDIQDAGCGGRGVSMAPWQRVTCASLDRDWQSC